LDLGEPVVRACLSIGVEGPRKASSLFGTLGTRFFLDDAWARLTALYSDYVGTAPIQNGTFAFTDLQPSRYRLEIFAGNRLLESREEDVRLFDNEIKIE
jgi:hypothetical protein